MKNSNSFLYGISVRGKSHKLSHTPNQDNFKYKVNDYGYAMCVCDGVGSNKYSKEGSRAACKAVLEVFNLFATKKIDEKEIGDNIYKYYKKNVSSRKFKLAATTCLFVYFMKTNEIIIGQIGDGNIMIKRNNNFSVYKDKTDEFTNEVIPLSYKLKNLNNYFCINKFAFKEKEKEELTFILATDGISEDIVPTKKEDFLDYYVEGCKNKGYKFLKNKIKNWSVPGSIDDKTIIIFNWRN